jgi:hypothetical protein
MRFLSVALACATLATAMPANAFVVPRWNTLRERRGSLLGSWRAVTYKKQSNVSVADPGITVSFDKAAVWVESSGKTEKGTWKLVTQDGDLLGVEITDDTGKAHNMDVLVESSDALTLYVADDSGDDDETLRLERIR